MLLGRLAPEAVAIQVAPFGPGAGRIRARFADGPLWRFRRSEPRRRKGRKGKEKTFALLASWRFQVATQVAPFGPGAGRIRARFADGPLWRFWRFEPRRRKGKEKTFALLASWRFQVATQVAPFGPGAGRIRARFVDGPLWRFRRFEPRRRKGRKGKEKTFALLASWRFQVAIQVAPFGPGAGRIHARFVDGPLWRFWRFEPRRRKGRKGKEKTFALLASWRFQVATQVAPFGPGAGRIHARFVDGPLWRFWRFEPRRRKGRKGKEKKKTFALLASWRFQVAIQVAPFGPGAGRIRARFVDGPLWRFRRFEPRRRKGRKGKEKKKTFALLASWRFQVAIQVAPFGPGAGRSASGPPGAVSTAIFDEAAMRRRAAEPNPTPGVGFGRVAVRQGCSGICRS